jgi:hypothetical protein
MTKLQKMVIADTVSRLLREGIINDPIDDVYKHIETMKSTVPSDKEIKENGYEGAVDNVYQQMVEAVTAE